MHKMDDAFSWKQQYDNCYEYKYQDNYFCKNANIKNNANNMKSTNNTLIKNTRIRILW